MPSESVGALNAGAPTKSITATAIQGPITFETSKWKPNGLGNLQLSNSNVNLVSTGYVAQTYSGADLFGK